MPRSNQSKYLENCSKKVSEVLASLREVSDIYSEPPAIPPCVYLLLRDGKVIYVGQSRNLHVRIASHRTAKDINPSTAGCERKKEFDEVLYLCVDEDHLDIFEGLLQEAFRPKFNGPYHVPSRHNR